LLISNHSYKFIQQLFKQHISYISFIQLIIKVDNTFLRITYLSNKRNKTILIILS